MLIRLISLLLLCSLIGCGSSGRSPGGGSGSAVKVYNVQRGDTLYSIAFRYGLDYREVAEVNRIPDPYIIYPGQNIYLWQGASSRATGAQVPATPAPAAKTAPEVATAVTTAASAPSGVVVTAVPGIAAAPVSPVVMPPTPVYDKPPAASSGVNQSGTAPVQAPPVETPPINAPAPPAGAGAGPVVSSGQVGAGATGPTLARVPGAAPTPTPAPIPAPIPARVPTPGRNVTSWQWPAAGAVTRSYSSSVHKGVDISGNRGDPIYAVADGTVVYAGTGIVGFGELLIVKHNDIYISAYGHNDRLLVRENDIVGAGQIIAEKGSSGTDTVKLHFEIRKEGKPVDPLKLLPRR